MNSWLNPGNFKLPLPKILRDVWQSFWIRYYFKFVLPKVTEAEISGVKLDLSSFSPRLRNRILSGYEQAEMHSCRELVRKDDQILELGGGIGFVGLFCQKTLGVKNYVTLEANPRTIEVLKRNYQLNGFTPNVLNFAISDRSGTIDLNVEGDFWEHNVESAALGHTMSIPAITFTDLLSRIPIRPNTLIIDIEGAERFIDFRKIPEDIKKIIIEIHPVVIGQAAVQQVVGALCERGFRVVCEEGNTMAFFKSS